VRFVKINVDHHPDLAEAYRVSSIPTVLLFVSGHVAGSSLGAKPAAALESDLGLAGLGDQGEPAGTGTGHPSLPGSVRPWWNGG
jgi:thioredoxin-like negative regulator of GroEL